MLLSIVKFLFTPQLMATTTDYSFIEIVAICTAGTSLGVLIFYYFGDLLFIYLASKRKKKPKMFTKRRRMIISIKNRYGLIGLLIVSGLISVPLASFLAARYFRSNVTMAYMVAAFFVWTTLLTTIGFIIKNFFS